MGKKKKPPKKKKPQDQKSPPEKRIPSHEIPKGDKTVDGTVKKLEEGKHDDTAEQKAKGKEIPKGDETVDDTVKKLEEGIHDDTAEQKVKEKGKKCYNPSDLRTVLESSVEVEKRLIDNCDIAGVEFHGLTPGNGNCFFEAVSSQLDRLGFPKRSAKDLRTSVSNYIKNNRNYQGYDGNVSLDDFVEGDFEAYCSKMSHDGVYADHVIVIGMARMLKHDILIITSSPSAGTENSLTWVVGDNNFRKQPLLLGHYYENHYQSLQPKDRSGEGSLFPLSGLPDETGCEDGMETIFTSKERTNYFRLCCAIIDSCTSVSRDILNKQIPPSEVENCIGTEGLAGLRPEQRSRIKSAASSGSYAEFDITLLYAVLRLISDPQLRVSLNTHIPPSSLHTAVQTCRALKVDLTKKQREAIKNAEDDNSYNCCNDRLLWKLYNNLCPTPYPNIHPTKPWGDSPDTKHITLGDDTERIREIRNTVYAHIPSTAISDKVFNDTWVKLEEIMIRMDKQIPDGQYKIDLDNIKKVFINDTNWKRRHDEIKRLQDEEKKLQRVVQMLVQDVVGIKKNLKEFGERMDKTDAAMYAGFAACMKNTQDMVQQSDEKIEALHIDLENVKDEVAKQKANSKDTDTTKTETQSPRVIQNYYYNNVTNVGPNSTVVLQKQKSIEEIQREVVKEADLFLHNSKVAEEDNITQDMVFMALIHSILSTKKEMLLQELETTFQNLFWEVKGKELPFQDVAKERMLHFVKRHKNNFCTKQEGNKWYVSIVSESVESSFPSNVANELVKQQSSFSDVVPDHFQEKRYKGTIHSKKDMFVNTINEQLNKSCINVPDSSHESDVSSKGYFKKRNYTNDPDEFVNDMDYFQKGKFVLLTCKNERGLYLESLALIPWLAVYDFDENSRVDGLLSILEERIKSQRAIYVSTWMDKPRFAEYSTYWCLIRGSKHEPISKTKGKPKEWLRMCNTKIEGNLENLLRQSEDFSVLKIVIIWPDDQEFVDYLHRFIRKIDERIKEPQPAMILIDSGRNKCQKKEVVIEDIEIDYTLNSPLKDLCLCIRKSLGQNEGKKKKLIYELPTAFGDDNPRIDEMFASSLRDNLEVLYLNTDPYGKDSFDRHEIESEKESFFRGATLRWFAYYSGDAGYFDADRDIRTKLVDRIKQGFVKEFRSGVVTLFHAPYAGGTTLSQRILWELRKETPCAKVKLKLGSNMYDLAQNVEELYGKTHLPIVLLLDGIEVEKVKFLMKCLEGAIVVVLHVCRNPFKMEEKDLNENRFWLPGEVTSEEAKRLTAKFIKKCDTDDKKNMLESLVADVSNGIPHYVYEFGLTTYLHEYKGLQSYVKGYLMLDKGELGTWQEILGFLSLVYYYGQDSMPCQMFATTLEKSPNYEVDLEDFPFFVQKFVVPCFDGRRKFVRIGYHVIAKEILDQILTRNMSKVSKENQKKLCNEAKRNLQEFVLRFIDFLRKKKPSAGKHSGTIISILTKLCIVRDYKDVDASDNTTKTKMNHSRLLEDIYSPPPYAERVQFFEKLVEAFPENPSFHAHFGRIIGIYRPNDTDRAEECYKKALKICKECTFADDEDSMKLTLMHVYHMYGMFYKSKLTKFTGRRAGEEPEIRTKSHEFNTRAEELVQLAEMACDLFTKGRENTPLDNEQSYGYIGEIKTRLHVCEFMLRNGPCENLFELMLRSDMENISAFVRESCNCVFELLMDCSGFVGRDFDVQFYKNLRWYNTMFKNRYPELDKLGRGSDSSTRRLKARLINLKYKVSDNFTTIDNVTDPSDVKRLVELYQENITDPGILGVDTAKSSLDLDYRNWMCAIRSERFEISYSLEHVCSYVRQWNDLLNSPWSTYYLFIMLSIIGFGNRYDTGNTPLLLEASDLKDRLKNVSKYLSSTKKPREWLGTGNGIRCLIPNQKIPKPEDAEKSKGTNHNMSPLAILKGTIARPNKQKQSGFITVDLGRTPFPINIFFVPIRTKEKLIGQAYAGQRVEFSLAFTMNDGYEAFQVALLKSIQCKDSRCGKRLEIKSDENFVKCNCGRTVFRDTAETAN